MESDLQFHQMFNEQQQQRQMNNSGLTRYQSAPSSLFSNLLECEDFFNRPTSPETERIFARFLASETNYSAQNQNFPAAPPAPEIKQESPSRKEEEIARQAQILASINDDSVLTQQPGFFQSQLKPPLPEQSSGMDYRMDGTGRPPAVRGGGTASNLVRHNSSPAGLFSNITIEMENGFAVMRGMGDSSAPYSSAAMGRMSPISEIGHKNMAENTPNDGVFDETHGGDFVTGYAMGSWDDNASSSAISKGLTEDNRTLSGLNAPETQNMESGIPAPPRLAHHLSLPKTAAEMSAIEKFLQDSVPCKIRAKRGFATHPRSIAERVRRTKISERMRKLQELVPNMDKQTNTSEMLDLAVEYIKDLQRQVKTLSDCRANCTCG